MPEASLCFLTSVALFLRPRETDESVSDFLVRLSNFSPRSISLDTFSRTPAAISESSTSIAPSLSEPSSSSYGLMPCFNLHVSDAVKAPFSIYSSVRVLSSLLCAAASPSIINTAYVSLCNSTILPVTLSEMARGVFCRLLAYLQKRLSHSATRSVSSAAGA